MPRFRCAPTPWGYSAHIPVRTSHRWGTWNKRLARRAAARGLLRGRAARCGQHFLVPGGAASGNPAQRILCGSPVCPVCGPGLWTSYRSGIQEAIEAWRFLGGRVCLLTFTVPHRPTDGLQALIHLLAECWSRVWAGRPGRRLRHDFGIHAVIRVLEVEDGKQGWHPHYHALLFVPASTDVDTVAALVQEVGSRWLRACTALGTPIHARALDALIHGKCLVNPQRGIADYLTKGPGRVVADLADRVADGDLRARARWRELQAALANRTRVHRSQGVARIVARALRAARRRSRWDSACPVSGATRKVGWPVTPRCRSPCRDPPVRQGVRHEDSERKGAPIPSK